MVPLLLWLSAFGQCPTCGAENAKHYGRYYPKAVAAAAHNICRVEVAEGGGVRSLGSGVLLAGNPVYVLTAAHVTTRAKRPVLCRFGKSTLVSGRVAVWGHRFDTSVIVLARRPEGHDGVELAKADLAMGEHAYAAGFGQHGQLRFQAGIRVNPNLADPAQFEITGKARSGDSGGPVLVHRAGTVRVIGPLWGTGHSEGRWQIIGINNSTVRKLFHAKGSQPHAIPTHSARPTLVPGYGSGPGCRGGS